MPVRPSVYLPIDPTNIVSWHVLSIFGKIDAESEEGRPVKSGHKPFDYGSGHEFKVS